MWNSYKNNILPVRLKVDATGDLMRWSQMFLRNAPNTDGGNAAHLIFSGVWNMEPGLLTLLLRTDSEAKKTTEYGSVNYNPSTSYQTYSKSFTKYLQSGNLLDLFDRGTCHWYQVSFGDIYCLASALQTASKEEVTSPTGYADMRDTTICLSKRTAITNQITMSSNRYLKFPGTDVCNPDIKPLYQKAEGTLPTIASGTE